MNGDRHKEPMDARRRQAVVHGLEILFSFGTCAGRYFMPQRFERREMHDTLRRHLEQHRVSPLVAYVVQTQVAQRMGAREHVRQDDVKALHCISPALLKSLAFAVHRKNLATVHILGALQGADDGFLKEVCSFGGACQVHSVNLARIASEPCSLYRAIVRICEPRTSKCQTCWTS